MGETQFPCFLSFCERAGECTRRCWTPGVWIKSSGPSVLNTFSLQGHCKGLSCHLSLKTNTSTDSQLFPCQREVWLWSHDCVNHNYSALLQIQTRWMMTWTLHCHCAVWPRIYSHKQSGWCMFISANRNKTPGWSWRERLSPSLNAAAFLFSLWLICT